MLDPRSSGNEQAPPPRVLLQLATQLADPRLSADDVM